MKDVYKIEITGNNQALYDGVPLSLSKMAWIKIRQKFPNQPFPFTVMLTFTKNKGGWLDIDFI